MTEKVQTNYIFLDVDGVLNRYGVRYNDHDEELDDYLISHLQKLVKDTNAVLILSSAWRDGWKENSSEEENPQNEPYFDRLVEKLAEHEMTLSDRLGKIQWHREDAIREYLEQHPEVQNFVILDDWNDMGEYTDRLILTNPREGLTEADVEKAKRLLGA